MDQAKSSRSQSIVREADVSLRDDGLQLDLGIRGAWQPQVEALFDIKVIHNDAQTVHPNQSWNLELKGFMNRLVSDWRSNFYTTSNVS